MKAERILQILIMFVLLTAGCQTESLPTEQEPVSIEQVETVLVEEAVVAAETVLPTEPPPPTEQPSEPVPTETAKPTPTAEPTSNSSAETDRIPTEGLFTLVGDEPVITPNGTAEATMALAFPGAVTYHDGLFHMFHNELEWWPSQVHVFYSTSPDGVSWTRVADEPLFLGEELNVPYTAFVSSVLVEEDNTWVLYFYTVDNPVSWETITEGSIGRATAPTPEGPWTADEEMILTAGAPDAWDSYCVQNPSVVRTDEGYVMYYTGYSERQAAIGMASSTDGVNWSKHDEPVFTRSGERGSWDNAFMIDPQVIITPDGWVMLYARSNKVGKHGPYGFAISEDGLNWRRGDDPIASAANVGPFMWAADFLYYDGTYYVYVESGRVSGGGESFSDVGTSPDADWNIYLLTYAGSLIP